MEKNTFTKDVEFDVQIDYIIKAKSDVANFHNQQTKTENVTFSGKKLDNLREGYSHDVGYDLTISQMFEIVFSNVHLFEDFCQIREEEGVFWPDSCSRDLFKDAFANYLLGRNWPMGDNSQEYVDQFFDDLNKTALDMGYRKIAH